MDKLELTIRYLLDNFVPFSIILFALIFLCLILYGLTIMLAVYVNNKILKVIGYITGVVFAIVLIITKIFSFLWTISYVIILINIFVK